MCLYSLEADLYVFVLFGGGPVCVGVIWRLTCMRVIWRLTCRCLCVIWRLTYVFRDRNTRSTLVWRRLRPR